MLVCADTVYTSQPVACAVIHILASKSATAMEFKSSLDCAQLIFGGLLTTFRTNAWKYKKEQE